MLSLYHVTIIKIMTVYIFLLSLQNLGCTLHLQHISVQNSLISRAQEHMWPVAAIADGTALSITFGRQGGHYSGAQSI